MRIAVSHDALLLVPQHTLHVSVVRNIFKPEYSPNHRNM